MVHSTRVSIAVICVLLTCGRALALDNGLGLTPAMGYNTWYDLMGDINEERCIETVDAFIAKGFPQFGYNYWNLDDLWSGGRNSDGSIYADPSKFPSKTLAPLAKYVHGKDLKFGAYTDRGTKQCGPGPGSQGHEFQDAQTFADWEIDYLKEDACSASQDHAVAFEQYKLMRDGLNKTGRPIYFSLCGWNPWYAPPDPALNYSGGLATANSWRIGPDDTNWGGLLTNININSQLSNYSGPGGWNDPCLLLSTDDRNNSRVTQLQSRFQFSMWAIMASPLIISGNVRNMSSYTVETYQNAEVIAINQDPLGLQGRRIVGGDMHPAGGSNPDGGHPNGAPIYAVTCNSSDLQQVWSFGANNTKTPPDTFYLNSWGKALDIYECQDKLVMWDWVTTGCDNNQGFYFKIQDGQFVANVSSNLTCAQDNGEGNPVTLGPCRQSATPWSIGSDGLIHTEGGRCLSPEAGLGAGTNIWARKLSNGATAIGFFNAGGITADVTCDADCLKDASVYGKSVIVRDVWKHANTSITNLTTLTAPSLLASGGHMLAVVYEQ